MPQIEKKQIYAALLQLYGTYLFLVQAYTTCPRDDNAAHSHDCLHMDQVKLNYSVEGKSSVKYISENFTQSTHFQIYQDWSSGFNQY